MEIATPPASPPPPPQEFRVDSAVLDAYPAASMSSNPFASGDDVAGNPFLIAAVTAPPSPNPFELLPPATAGTDPFDLFQHFTSAPASPTRAAAIYAQFSGVDGNGADHDRGGDDDDDDVDGFLHRLSYSTPTVNSTVPFDWEEKPGKPKPVFASTATVPFGWEEKPGKPKAVFASMAATANGDVNDADFDFGVLLDRASQTLEPTAADELFDEGKIRPLKPPPRLLDSGSVGSSPRSAKSAMWSPRRRNLVGPGADFDPFAAAMAKASRAPSPLGAGAKDAADAGTHTVPKDDPGSGSATSPPPTVPPPTGNGWRKKWRLSDLLLFRRLSAKGRAAGTISKDPVFKYSPVQRLGTPAKNATAEPANGNVISTGKHKKHSKPAPPAPVGAEGGGMSTPRRQSMVGCVWLNPGLHRLTKGINVPSSHFRRRAGRTSTMTMGK